jgi:hypothetical protein
MALGTTGIENGDAGIRAAVLAAAALSTCQPVYVRVPYFFLRSSLVVSQFDLIGF